MYLDIIQYEDRIKRLLFITLVGVLFFFQGLSGQSPVCKINTKGGIDYLYFSDSVGDTVFFNSENLSRPVSGKKNFYVYKTENFSGPSLQLNGEELLFSRQVGENCFEGNFRGVEYSIKYISDVNCLGIVVSCKNISNQNMEDIQFSLRLGINTCMKTYPEWRSIYFPTLLKCEKTHFWGYFMRPDGNILTVTSPDPIASYHLHYNNTTRNFGHGHWIHTASLDLLNPGPLPEENPENCHSLKKGESRSWTINLSKASRLSDVGSIVCEQTRSPFVSADYYTIEEGGLFNIKIQSQGIPKVTVVLPDGKKSQLRIESVGNGKYISQYKPTTGKGVYKLSVQDGSKISKAWLSVRYDWTDYLKAAREACLKYSQKATSHTESWYGFFSAYIAKKYFPENETDCKVEDKFQELYPLMYDVDTKLPTSWHDRIQNHAMMASLFAFRYKADKNIEDLYVASILADYILTKQTPDGVYRSHKVHYTSVIYIAKAIMEIMKEEKVLAEKSDYWSMQYNRHYTSVKMAMDELASSLDDIQTEGQQTFEDGMISCSYSQLAMFALLHPEGSAERKKYLDASLYLVSSHRCLSQLLIPDSRVNGGSLRFWESQYDILTYPNFINSPHGWSAWRIYGLKYLYQLTGQESYLTEMMNALGSCVQLLDPSTGKLNWAFVNDPYVKVNYFVEDKEQKGKGMYIDKVIGREYLPMISDWYQAPKDTWVTGYWGFDGGCCDNNVHEIFKCVGEVALTSAYFHLRDDGTCITLNCNAEQKDDCWFIEPKGELINTLYTNAENISHSDLVVIKVSNK